MEKRFPPSLKKLNDLRKKGDVAKSVDLSGSIVIFIAIICAAVGFPAAWRALSDLLVNGLTLAFLDAEVVNGVRLVGYVAPFVWVPLFIAGVIGTIVSFLTVGPVFSSDAISPKFERMNPANGVKKLFSAQQLVVAGKGLFAITILSIAFFLLVRYQLVSISKMPFRQQSAALLAGSEMLLSAIILAAVTGLVIGVSEANLSKYLYIKKNMMTREEVERESKEQQGNPLVKSRRRQIAFEEMENDAVRNTSDAELLIVNPTHIAIAVKGESKLNGAPVVIGKGRGSTAAKMREIAAKKGIPIIRNRPLARSLFVDAKVRHPIPAQYIKAVSQALSWVRKMETFKKQQKVMDVDVKSK
jgi:type III secretion protein U